MAGIARLYVDTAGGTILGSGNSTVIVNGTPAAVLNDSISGHGNGEHSGPSMVSSSGTVYCQGMPVCRLGDTSSCGHPATGSGNVHAGG